MGKIKAILFDLDDTLLWDDRSVKESFEAACETACSRYPQLNKDKLEEEVRKAARALYETYETFPFTKMIGINPFEGLWGRFIEGKQEEFRKMESLVPGYRTAAWTQGLLACGVDDPQLGYELGEQFATERRSRPIVYEETFEVLEQLKKNYKLLLLTNGSPDLQKEKLAMTPELTQYFDHIVISGEFGKGKPAVEIFHHAMELLGIQPEDGVMIGDKLTTDILGSNLAGMRNMWINRHGVQRTDEIVPKHEIKSLREIEVIINQL